MCNQVPVSEALKQVAKNVTISIVNASTVTLYNMEVCSIHKMTEV